MARVLQAFNASQTLPGSAGIILGNFKGFGNLFRNSVLLTEIVLGDIVLIYRCYVAWGGNPRILMIPILTVLGSAATSAGVIYSFATAPPPSEINVFALKKLQYFILATQTLVLFNNMFCTGLLSWKLWRMSRALLSRPQRRSLRAVAKIILQSGLITTVTWIIWMTLTLLRQPCHIIVLNSLAPITGATFCMIVSRVALGMGSENKSADELPRTQIDRSRGPILPVLDGTGRRHRPMQITISSRESIRIENGTQYKDKMALAGLPAL
ncbi:hypothetical protein M422DRAFT_36677 [Sphaerobolus stellatus SS14]|uniref:Uncharacterized protein n=1 Tax=Sphaerobolus stellatus (strain SS14) TaxID=990650 RepID=A0A0C9UXT2_SPHS4|nr:hypothetical protein M422DRAFT_36677 [Sphaerobolus stellatus SS14]